MRATLRVIGLAMLLGGCAGAFGSSVTGMTPEQLEAFAKVKDAGCSTLTGVYMGATFTATNVSIDRGIPPGAGTVKINGKTCDTEITAEPKEKK